jgi:transcriptional regulator with XRE-family HTH domain
MHATLTNAQLRAARGLVNWTTRDLAEKTSVHRNTISAFESGKSSPNSATLQTLARALEAAGVIFVEENGEGPGVRLRKAAKPSPLLGG